MTSLRKSHNFDYYFHLFLKDLIQHQPHTKFISQGLTDSGFLEWGPLERPPSPRLVNIKKAQTDQGWQDLDIKSLYLACFSQLNTGQASGPAGVDMNVLPVWRKNITGRGIVISVLDDGKKYVTVPVSCSGKSNDKYFYFHILCCSLPWHLICCVLTFLFLEKTLLSAMHQI